MVPWPAPGAAACAASRLCLTVRRFPRVEIIQARDTGVVRSGCHYATFSRRQRPCRVSDGACGPIPETFKIGERMHAAKVLRTVFGAWTSGAAATGARRPGAGAKRGVHDVGHAMWLDGPRPGSTWGSPSVRAATELPPTAAARAFMWLSSRMPCRQRATAHSPEIAKSSARCASRVARSISLKQGLSSIRPLLMAARRTPSMPTAVHRPEMSPSSIRSSLRRAR